MPVLSSASGITLSAGANAVGKHRTLSATEALQGVIGGLGIKDEKDCQSCYLSNSDTDAFVKVDYHTL